MLSPVTCLLLLRKAEFDSFPVIDRLRSQDAIFPTGVTTRSQLGFLYHSCIHLDLLSPEKDLWDCLVVTSPHSDFEIMPHTQISTRTKSQYVNAQRNHFPRLTP